MTGFDWDGLWKFLLSALGLIISYQMWRTNASVNKAVSLGHSNSDKLDVVSKQSDGLTDQLVALTAKSSHAKGMLDERADVAARSTPLDSRVGPDRLNTGKTDEPV